MPPEADKWGGVMIPTKLYNNKKLKSYRSRLSRKQTDTEKLLWSRLRNKQIQGIKFFRQYSIGKYILDFYCPKFRLAIEVDGGQHATSVVKRDRQKANFLGRQDIQVLRFWNTDLIDNLDGVLEVISKKLKL